MKTIMISVHPQHALNILTGEKTIEVRKTKPKCDLPFRVVVYVTKKDINLFIRNGKSKASPKFVTIEKSKKKLMFFDLSSFDIDAMRMIDDELEPANGKVVAEFVCDRVDIITTDSLSSVAKKACLTESELDSYLGVVRNSNFNHYAWGKALHITDLKVYDKPKELNKFCTAKKCKPLENPPQNFMYVEEL